VGLEACFSWRGAFLRQNAAFSFVAGGLGRAGVLLAEGAKKRLKPIQVSALVRQLFI